MIYQKMVEMYGKFTNIFFLSKMLARLSYIVIILVTLSLLGLVSFWIFPSWYCTDCQRSSEECSSNYGYVVSQGVIALCDQLATPRPQWNYDHYCRERCRVDVAITHQDPEECEPIPRLRPGA